MTFWQENYSFIKEVYDTRYSKMVEWMDNVEMAIQKVCASKVYTSAEFKREKDNFHVREFIFQIHSWNNYIIYTHMYMLTCYIENSFFSQSLCKNLERAETKRWLKETLDTLMKERAGEEKKEENR